jgi:SpoIID/LytB domain protein
MYFTNTGGVGMKIKYLQILLATVILLTLFAAPVCAGRTVRVGLYHDGAGNAATVDWVRFTNNAGLGASFVQTNRLDLPVSYSRVALAAGAGNYVQIGAGRTFEAAWQLAQEARSSWNYKAYVAYITDNSQHPYKTWVEGAEAAARVHYHGAFGVSAGSESVRLADDSGNSPGLIAADRGGILLAPLSSAPTGTAAAGQLTRLYEGAFEVRGRAGRVSVVNEPDLEQYVFGVVPYEVSDSWPPEALKAQAVAARSYALANWNKHRTLGFELCDSPACCQKYAGYNAAHINSRRAVEETAGLVALFGGQVAQLFYHSNSGGHTENSENVWSAALPYARAVADPYSVCEPLVGHLASRAGASGEFPARWLMSYTRGELEMMLAAQNLGVGALLEINSLSRSPAGRHQEILIRGTAGQRTITRSATRFAFNLHSSLYEIIPVHRRVHVAGAGGGVREVDVSDRLFVTGAGGSVAAAPSSQDVWINGSGRQRQVSKLPVGFSFDGRGWGHGVGMSQWGAFEMARRGYTFSDILQYYFQGITIGTR